MEDLFKVFFLKCVLIAFTFPLSPWEELSVGWTKTTFA